MPGYERASKAMFEQLHTAFQGGLAGLAAEVQSPISEMVAGAASKASASHEAHLANSTRQVRTCALTVTAGPHAEVVTALRLAMPRARRAPCPSLPHLLAPL